MKKSNVGNFLGVSPYLWIPATAIASVIFVAMLSVGVLLVSQLVGFAWKGTADESIRAATAALTVIAAVFGAAFLTWRSVVAQWQARASQQQVSIAKDSHYTTQFVKAVELLGATRDEKEQKVDRTTEPSTQYDVTITKRNLEVRLGAIYTFERIARESPRDHNPIVEILSAYIRSRDNTGAPQEFEEPPNSYGFDYKLDTWLELLPHVALDVQVAVDVLGRRANRLTDELKSRLLLDFREANLQRANFFHGLFSFSRFTSTYLQRTAFMSAHLEGSLFAGSLLTGANFAGAHLDGALFFDIDLRYVQNLSDDQLATTFGDASTSLQPHRNRPPNWAGHILDFREREEMMRRSRALAKEKLKLP